MELLKQKLNHLSLKYKILSLIITGILIVFLSGLLTTELVSRSYEKKLYRSIASTLSYSVQEISDELEYFDTIVDSIFSNQTIQNELEDALHTNKRSEKQIHYNKVYSTLCNYFFTFHNDALSYISILQNQSVISTSDSELRKLPENIKEDLLLMAQRADGATTVISKYGADYGIFIVKELRRIQNLSLNPLGVLMIRIDMEKLIKSSISSISEYDDTAYFLFDKDTNLIYHDNLLSAEGALKLTQSMKQPYDIIEAENQKLFAVSDMIPIYEWNCICTVSYNSIYQTITLSGRSFFLLMLLATTIVSYCSIRIVLALFRRFDCLIHNMKLFGEGNYTAPVQPQHYPEDEIGLLYQNFDRMVEKIQLLIQENYVNELLKKEAQIKAMESQMDPHFLYNTLDSINWRARMIKSEEISQITTSLGNLLRLSLSKNSQNFTLGQELTLVENYITIQKIRYQKRLEFHCNIPDNLMDILIPKFTIQPLLENAIRYGLEESSDPCFISITQKQTPEDLIIKITNTGSSFEENFMEKLLNEEITPHGFGIGILNIHKRIQMTYGTAYGLNLYTEETEDTYEEYAVAEINIPKIRSTEKC